MAASDVVVVEIDVSEAPEPRGLPAFLAEILGTFVLVLAIAGTLSAQGGLPGGPNLTSVALVHGLALMVLVYVLGGVSGAHLNPAVTMGLLSVRKISPGDALVYVICQVTGGVLAGLLVLLLFNDVGEAVNYGAATVNPGVVAGGSVWLALIAEGAGTFILMLAIMGLAVNPRGEAALAGVGIGGALAAAVFIIGPATGAAVNPARWFGTALVAGEFSDFWLYIAGPVIGAVLAAVIFRAVVLRPRGLPAQQPRDDLPG